MNRTENYSLPQWEKSDRIMMDDFNGAMSSIDTGIAAAKSTASTAVTLANVARAAAANAQSTADTARQEASSLYAVGSYTGTGQAVTIEVGFRPRAVLIDGLRELSPGTGLVGSYEEHCAFTTGHNRSKNIVFTDTGFIVDQEDNVFPRLIAGGRVYDYIAFR